MMGFIETSLSPAFSRNNRTANRCAVALFYPPENAINSKVKCAFITKESGFTADIYY